MINDIDFGAIVQVVEDVEETSEVASEALFLIQ
jgi:hypothetical protein